MTDWTQNTGAKLYRKAKELIPGGTQLLSKRPELFLPDQWPSYYSKAKGCEVWDLDGNHFYDMTTCGIGSCLLGHADDDVNAAVKDRIDRSNMSTLNCPEEVELAELLTEIHPWADMVRYARTGGETMAVAARIARASTGRDKIAICGYHGWHDWYLAAGLTGEDTLSGHLLSGLKPVGVPKALAGTILPFRYNQIEELEAIVAEHGDDLAAVIMEPMRYTRPTDGFLQKVREITTRTGAVMVIDEITMGNRLCVGGTHKILDVEPDIACFAKSISNGFPMGAIIGRRDVMEAVQDSFISSTYWTEGIGSVAALTTLKKMQRVDLPAHIDRVGKYMNAGWLRLDEKHDLGMELHGEPAIGHFTIECGDDVVSVNTLLTQCMLDRGFLANTGCYLTLAHTEEIVDKYLVALDETLEILKEAVEKDDVMSRLRGPVAQVGFKRLT